MTIKDCRMCEKKFDNSIKEPMHGFCSYEFCSLECNIEYNALMIENNKYVPELIEGIRIQSKTIDDDIRFVAWYNTKLLRRTIEQTSVRLYPNTRTYHQQLRIYRHRRNQDDQY